VGLLKGLDAMVLCPSRIGRRNPRLALLAAQHPGRSRTARLLCWLRSLWRLAGQRRARLDASSGFTPVSPDRHRHHIRIDRSGGVGHAQIYIKRPALARCLYHRIQSLGNVAHGQQPPSQWKAALYAIYLTMAIMGWFGL